jgi:hypothetical protein
MRVNSCGQLLGRNEVGERQGRVGCLPAVHAILPPGVDDDAFLRNAEGKRKWFVRVEEKEVVEF